MGMNGRLLRPKVSGFNPRQIPDMAAWWDFNDSATVTIETGIKNVTDKSGNSRTLAQTTTNNQPAWTPSALNGKYVADFDGTNDTLRVGFTLVQPYTVFIVGRYNGTNPNSNQTMFDGFTGGNRGRVFWSGTADTQLGANAGAALSLPASPAASATTYAVHEAIFNGASSYYAWNGSPTVSGNAGSTAPGGVTIGAFGTGGTAQGQVSVAAVLMYSRALSAAQLTTLRRWLASLYALTVT
jgi:hypothetical protein